MPTPVYAGKLAAMPELPVGSLPPGGSRTYVFTALLPEGADDNAYAGSLMTVRYVWTATNPAAPALPARPDAPPRIRLRVPPIQRVVTRARFRAFARCNEACRITAYARVPVGGGRRVRTRSVNTRRLRRAPAGPAAHPPASALRRDDRALPAPPRAGMADAHGDRA